jgi:asparagine synthase (glutamine-hydrolysing)
MCGICGKYFSDPDARVSPAEIQCMADAIAHRGPDGQGFYVRGQVGLGHRRLAIIDLSTGDQPMTNEDESVWIVFNGEVYNFQELREKLLAKGHTFKSRSDTEVIVHAYEELGPDCVTHLRGMFAFAIWDVKRQRLFLARDRVGIKPLYYCQTKDALYFASELKSIITDPAVPRDLNFSALRLFFSFNYLPGPDTLFKNIHKLLPGHYLIAEQGRISIRQYWDLQFTDKRCSLSFEDAAEELRSLLSSTVSDHMIADVPVGILLSGGVDSSAVLSFAVQNTNKKVKTFTVGFDGDQVVDERSYARMAAERFHTEHYETTITAQDFWDFLPSYVWHMEEPVCEPPAVALYYVTKLARNHVKVLLSGEGGDEAFGGYVNYRNMLRLQRLCGLLGPLARPAGALAEWLGRFAGDGRIERYGYAMGRPLAAHYFSRTSGPTSFFNRYAERFFTPDFLHATGGCVPSTWGEGQREGEPLFPQRSTLNPQLSSSEGPSSAAAFIAHLSEPVRNEHLLNQMLYIDTKTWLPDDLLVKADKITMANSLELRVPLLDHVVLEFAASLPVEFKVLKTQSKRLLKAAFAKVLPEQVLTRKKAGFPVPYESWLRNGLRGRVEDILLSNRALGRGYFRKREVSRLLKSNAAGASLSKEAFCLIAAELWHRAFTDAVPKQSA